MGLGTQMVGWPDGFCAALAERGFHVIRYDNRDIGRSTHLRHVRPPTTVAAPPPRPRGRVLRPRRHGRGRHRPARRARDPGRARRRRVHGRDDRPAHGRAAPGPRRARWPRSCPTPATAGAACRGCACTPCSSAARPRDRQGAIDATVEVFRRHRLARLPVRRGRAAVGRRAQLRARRTTPPAPPASSPPSSRRATAAVELRRITAPTVVIHGTKDRMVTPSGGRTTARADPGRRARVDRGHGPRPAARRVAAILDAVVANAARADLPARRRSAA